MSHLIVDMRDIRFLLYEQFEIEKILEFERYEDYDKTVIDGVVDEMIKLAIEKIAPVNEPGDREGCRVENGRVFVPEAYHDAYKAIVNSGWIGAGHSVESGGQQLPLPVTELVTEAINAGCQAFYMYPGLTAAASRVIVNFCTEELKSTYVPKMLAGEWGGTMCLTEPQAGSSVGDSRTTATPDGDAFLIQGDKIFISGGDADFYENVVHLVLARIDGDPEGTQGLSLFVVPRNLPDDSGEAGEDNSVYVEGIEHKMGINGSATCQISFGQRGTTRGWLIGERCKGLKYMFQMMNEARIACGIQGSSLANASYQQALAYARDRVQGIDFADPEGGNVAIIEHPDVRRNLLWMKTFAEGLRGLITKAAVWAEYAEFHPDDEVREKCDNLLNLATPIVKAYATDKGFDVTVRGIQVLGGYGYCQDYPLEQYARDCKIASIYEGTNGIQALDLLGRKMRWKGGALFMTYVMELGSFVQEHADNEAISGIISRLSAAQEKLGEVAFWLSSKGKEDMHLSLLQATPFLELFGDIMLGHVIAEQAAIAAAALEENFGTIEPDAELREKNRDAAFYYGKLQMARFFSDEILIHAPSKAASMTSGNSAALDVTF